MTENAIANAIGEMRYLRLLSRASNQQSPSLSAIPTIYPRRREAEQPVARCGSASDGRRHQGMLPDQRLKVTRRAGGLLGSPAFGEDVGLRGRCTFPSVYPSVGVMSLVIAGIPQEALVESERREESTNTGRHS